MSSRGRRHSTLPLPGEGGNPAPDTWPPLTPRIGRGSLYLLGRVESSCFPNSSWTSQIVLASQIVHPTNIMMGGLCYNWVTVKALTLLWHNPRRKDSGVRQYCWVGMEFQAPHMSSTDIRGMEQPLGVKVLAPHFAFSDTTPVVLLIPPPQSPGKGERLQTEFNHHWPMIKTSHAYLHHETSIKTPNDTVQRVSRFMNTRRCWKGGAPRECIEALHYFPHILPYTPLPFDCLWVVCFVIKW